MMIMKKCLRSNQNALKLQEEKLKVVSLRSKQEILKWRLTYDFQIYGFEDIS